MNQQTQALIAPNIDIPTNPFQKNKRFIGIQKSPTPTSIGGQNVQVEIEQTQNQLQDQNYILYSQIQGLSSRANSSLIINNAPQETSLFNLGISENSLAVGTPVTTPRQQSFNLLQQNNSQMPQLQLASNEQQQLMKQQELMNIKNLIQQGSIQIDVKSNGNLANHIIESINNSKESLVDYKQKIQNLIQNEEDSSSENTSQGLDNLVICLETANKDNKCNILEEKTVLPRQLDFSKKSLNNMDIIQSVQNPLSRDPMSPLNQNSIKLQIQKSTNPNSLNQINTPLSQNYINPLNQYSNNKIGQDSFSTTFQNQMTPQIINSIQKINDKNNKQHQNEEYAYTIKKNGRSGSTDVYSQQSNASINFYSPRIIKTTPKKEELYPVTAQNDQQARDNYILQFIDPNSLNQNMNNFNTQKQQQQQSNVNQDNNTQLNKINSSDKSDTVKYSSIQASPYVQNPFGIKIADGINTIERQQKDKQYASINNDLHLSSRNTSRVIANNISISGSINNKQQLPVNEGNISPSNQVSPYPFENVKINSQQQSFQQTAQFNIPQFSIAPRISLSRQASTSSISNTPKNFTPISQNQNKSQFEITSMNFASNQNYTANNLHSGNVIGLTNNINQMQHQIPQMNSDFSKREFQSDKNIQYLNGFQTIKNFSQSIENNIGSTFERGKSETRLNYSSQQYIPISKVDFSNVQLNNQEKTPVDDSYLKQIVSPETMKILEEQREMKKAFAKFNSQSNLPSPQTNKSNLVGLVPKPGESLTQNDPIFIQSKLSVQIQSPLKQLINPNQKIQDSSKNILQNFINQPQPSNQQIVQRPQVISQQQQVTRPKILSSRSFVQKQQQNFPAVAGLSLLSVNGGEQSQINTIQGVSLLNQAQFLPKQQNDPLSFLKVQYLSKDQQKFNTDRVYQNQQLGLVYNSINQQREKANSLYIDQIQNHIKMADGSILYTPLQYRSLVHQNQQQNDQNIQQVNQQYPIPNQQNQEEMFTIASFNNQSYQSRDIQQNNSQSNILQVEDKQKQEELKYQQNNNVQYQYIENQRETFDCNTQNQNQSESKSNKTKDEFHNNKRFSNNEIEQHLNYKNHQFMNQYVYDVTEKHFTPEKLNVETPTNYFENIDEFNQSQKKVNKISPPQSYSPCFNKQQTQSSPNQIPVVLQSFGVHPTQFQQTFQQAKQSNGKNEKIQQIEQNQKNDENKLQSPLDISQNEINSPNKLQDGSQYYVQSNFTNFIQSNPQNQQVFIKNQKQQLQFDGTNSSNASESKNMIFQGNEAVKRSCINKSQNSYQSNQDNSLKQAIQSKKIQSKNDSQQEEFEHLTNESIEVDLQEKNNNLIYDSKQDLTPHLKRKSISGLQYSSGNGFKKPINQEKVKGLNNSSINTSDKKQRQNQYSKNVQQINNKQRSAISAHRSSKPEDILQEQILELQKQTKKMIEKSQKKIQSSSQERSSLQTKQIKNDGGKSPLSFEKQMKQILQSANGVNLIHKGSATASSRNYKVNSSLSKESQGLIPKSEITMRKVDQSNIISIINSSNMSYRNSLQDISPMRQNQPRSQNDRNVSSLNSINLKINQNTISQTNIDKNQNSSTNYSNIGDSKLDLSKTKIQATLMSNNINNGNNSFSQSSNISKILSKANLIDHNSQRPLTNSTKINNLQSNPYHINNNLSHTIINQKSGNQKFETERNNKTNDYHQNEQMDIQSLGIAQLNMQSNGKANRSENNTIQATVNNAYKGIDKSKVACQWQTRSQIKNLLKMKSDTYFSQQNSTKNQYVNDKKMNFKQ